MQWQLPRERSVLFGAARAATLPRMVNARIFPNDLTHFRAVRAGLGCLTALFILHVAAFGEGFDVKNWHIEDGLPKVAYQRQGFVLPEGRKMEGFCYGDRDENKAEASRMS